MKVPCPNSELFHAAKVIAAPTPRTRPPARMARTFGALFSGVVPADASCVATTFTPTVVSKLRSRIGSWVWGCPAGFPQTVGFNTPSRGRKVNTKAPELGQYGVTLHRKHPGITGTKDVVFHHICGQHAGSQPEGAPQRDPWAPIVR